MKYHLPAWTQVPRSNLSISELLISPRPRVGLLRKLCIGPMGSLRDARNIDVTERGERAKEGKKERRKEGEKEGREGIG